MVKVIERTQINGFLDALLKEYRVYAPVKEDSMVTFKQIKSSKEAFLDYDNSKNPPKSIFFPQSEAMFEYKRREKDYEIAEVEIEKGPNVLFGIRPCDIKSFALLDKVFDSKDFKDTYYVEKRGSTFIVGMGCNNPRSTCFCTSLGFGPFSVHGSDVFLSCLPDKYLAEAITEKGKELVRGYSDAAQRDLDEKMKIEERAISSIKNRINIASVTEKLKGMFIDDSFWKEIAEKCINCAVCTYLCPTCHCFDIQDEAVNSKGQRVRNWDSCMFPLFTLQASGYNPRPEGFQRMRQRIMHKFNYFVENYGEVACVGCGRCIVNCPVNFDIRQILKRVAE
jgi:ferredoxin